MGICQGQANWKGSLKVSLKFQGLKKRHVSNLRPGSREANNQAKEEPWKAHRVELGGQLPKRSLINSVIRTPG